MAPKPLYVLFAGVNGAGKSTLFHTGMWHHGGISSTLPRVNSDEIIAEKGWDWRSEADQIKAGKEAVRRIRSHFENHESFNQETTLTGRSIMRNIQRAHDEGYCIVMFYVCVNDPAIANDRIAHRGESGGHLVDESVVKRRYDASLTNLTRAIELCDETYLYDNTVSLELEARFEHNLLAYFSTSTRNPPWLTRTLESLGYFEIEF